jgi:hypothetical protein
MAWSGAPIYRVAGWSLHCTHLTSRRGFGAREGDGMVEIRDILIDGITQLGDWMDDALDPLTAEQVNWLPDGKTVSIGFNAWHVMRTTDNIVNFVFQKKQPIWMAQGYLEQMGGPKVEQGTGMTIEIARSIRIEDPSKLREYGKKVTDDCLAFLKAVPMEELEQVQMVKPLGEMPKWRVCRQVLMTHGFMHLGEINAIKGTMGLQFSI